METLAARVEQLPGESGTLEFEVATRMPDALVSSADTLVLALVQLDAAGERVAQRRVGIPPGGEETTVRIVADEDVRTLAIEIFNSSLACAAVIRVPILPEDAGAADITVR